MEIQIVENYTEKLLWRENSNENFFGIFDQCAKIYLGLVGTVSKNIQKCIKNENLIKKLEQNGKLKKNGKKLNY